MDKDKIVFDVLDAREKRSALRNEISQSGRANISLTLNIPGYPKQNTVLDIFYKHILGELKIFLIANGIFIEKDEINIVDGAGHFFMAAIPNDNLVAVKNITEKFEVNHELGRLLDVDIFDTNNLPISSGKKKSCIICNRPAIECMRNHTHTFEELRKVIFEKTEIYNQKKRKSNIKRKLIQFATKSLLYEVSLTPKPGLVDFNDSGSHTDMDFQTFLNSTSALSPYWAEMAELGLNYNGNLKDSLNEIRQIGLRAEAEMFEATNGVNTQKGLIFLLGISVFTSAYSLKDSDVFSEETFITSLKTIGNNIIERELKTNLNNQSSHGIEVFKKYGDKGAGARYQIQYAFPLIFNTVLPFLDKNLSETILSKKDTSDKILSKTLYLIISELDDTNVMFRKGIETAEKLKSIAKEVLEKKADYKELYYFCSAKNISAGGAADMLAISLFLFFVKRQFAKS